MKITTALIIQWLQKTAQVLEENKEHLTKLDADIGDADHGINMTRGFHKVSEKLAAASSPDIGAVLKDTAMTLISSVGGASGPLYGSFFLRASRAGADKQELSLRELADLLSEGLIGVVERGRAEVGDKTMVDALDPAVKTLISMLEEGTEAKEALRATVQAAEEGMKETIPLIARKGRASYLGERSRDHQDPGATSSYLILKCLYDTLA